jgi:hypothetical protein
MRNKKVKIFKGIDSLSEKGRKIFKGIDSLLGKGQKGKLLYFFTGNLFVSPSGRAV